MNFRPESMNCLLFGILILCTNFGACFCTSDSGASVKLRVFLGTVL